MRRKLGIFKRRLKDVNSEMAAWTVRRQRTLLSARDFSMYEDFAPVILKLNEVQEELDKFCKVYKIKIKED